MYRNDNAQRFLEYLAFSNILKPKVCVIFLYKPICTSPIINYHDGSMLVLTL